MPAGMVDEDLAHELRGDAEEMDAALPGGLALVDEAHVGFMDEGSGLQGVVATFAAEVALGQTAEFLVDERRELIERRLVALLPVNEELSDFFRRGVHVFL